MKRVLALMLAVVIGVSFTACTGADKKVVASSDGKNLPAGVYILFQLQALNEASSHEDYDSAKKDLFENKIEGKSLADWANAKAKDSIATYYQVEKEFKAMGLKLEKEDQDQIDNVDSAWADMAESYEKVGISKKSYQTYLENSLKKEALFNAYYAEGGTKEIPNEELVAHFKDEYAHVKAVNFSKLDSQTGENLDKDGLEKVKQQAEGYLQRAQAGEDFDELIKARTAEREAEAAEASEEDTSSKEEKDTSSEADTDESKAEDEGTASEEPAEEPEEEAAAEEKETSNLIMVQKDETSYYFGEKVVKGIFEDAKVGEPVLMSDDSAFYVILRFDITENPETYDEMRETVLLDLKADDFNEELAKSAESLKIDYYDDAIKRYKPEKLAEGSNSAS